jgi:hypothetical protein
MQVFFISRDVAINQLAQLGLSQIVVDDDLIYYTTEAEWKPVLIEAAAGLPAYEKDRFDCDKFAIAVMGEVYKRYQLNGLGIMRGGTSNGGYHAWLAYATDNGIRFFEPQTKEFFKPGEKGLVPDTYGIT